MSNPRNVGEAFRPPAGDLKVAPTSFGPFEAFYRTMSNYFVRAHQGVLRIPQGNEATNESWLVLALALSWHIMLASRPVSRRRHCPDEDERVAGARERSKSERHRLRRRRGRRSPS